jgi:hypothetical protein
VSLTGERDSLIQQLDYYKVEVKREQGVLQQIQAGTDPKHVVRRDSLSLHKRRRWAALSIGTRSAPLTPLPPECTSRLTVPNWRSVCLSRVPTAPRPRSSAPAPSRA